LLTASIFAIVLMFGAPAFAQGGDDDGVLKLAEPDFTLIAMPTSLRLPLFKSAFRVTHRFVRPLKCDVCADSLLEDLFGIDNGALIGLEYRIGIVPGGQFTFHRARERKTIQLSGQYGLMRQGNSPLEVALLGSIEGTENFKDEYSGAIGLVLTRMFGEIGAIHVDPMYVGNTNLDEPLDDDDNTFLVGIGARLRVRPTVYVTAEFVPRASGYKPGVNQASFAIEKRAGGHMFQLNFSNSQATTPGSMARGGVTNDNWYMGFNISRKFF
jgi:hypothetical protein